MSRSIWTSFPSRSIAGMLTCSHPVGAVDDRESSRPLLRAHIPFGIEHADEALLVDRTGARPEHTVRGADEDLDLGAAIDLDEGRAGVTRIDDAGVVLDDRCAGG